MTSGGLFERAHEATAGRDRRVAYDQQGRGGTVWYHEQGDTGALRLGFGWEFGGGDCVAIVFVPEPERWEAFTGLALARRDDVLDHVARCVLRDQMSAGGRCVVEPGALTFHRL